MRTLLWFALALMLAASGLQAFAGGLTVTADRITSPATTWQATVPKIPSCPVDHQPGSEPGEVVVLDGQRCFVVEPVEGLAPAADDSRVANSTDPSDTDPADQHKEPADQDKEPIDQNKEPADQDKEPADQENETGGPGERTDG